MGARAADNSEPGSLASMLEVGWEAGPTWGERDLAAVLQHQLAAPVVCDLGPAGADAAAPPAGIRTFGDLLHHPAPPVELLVLAKDFAKASLADPHAALPKEVAAVLYFAAIVVARRRCGARISQLSPEELRAGAEWVMAQPWVDPATRRLFESAGTGP
jgi:hypothetical protein